MQWSSRVVAELRELKDTGVPFEIAWRMALERHPPSSRDLGPARPTLFDPGIPDPHLDGEGELSVVEFLRCSCDDAWHGRRKILEHLHVLLDRMDAIDDAFLPTATRKSARNQNRALRVV